jgi:hypothetical protein
MSGQYVYVKIKMEHFRALAEASDITGVQIQAMLDEALGQYVECDVACMVEEQAGRTATA